MNSRPHQSNWSKSLRSGWSKSIKVSVAMVTAIPGTRRNGDGPRVPNTTNVSFAGIEAESLLGNLAPLSGSTDTIWQIGISVPVITGARMAWMESR